MLGNSRHKLITIENGVQAFYLNSFLRTMYMGMTVIFTPIFLYTRGVDVYGSAKAGLLVMISYHLLQRSLIILSVIPISKIIEKIGFRRSVAVSIIFLILQTLSLMLANQSIYFVWLAALFMSWQTPFYWISRDSVLSQDSRGKQMGKSLANLAGWETIGTVVGPLLSGWILATSGFVYMYGVAVILLVLSILPLWKMHSHSHKNGVSWNGFWYWLKDKRYTHTAIANTGYAVMDYSLSVVWPLILFIRGLQVQTLGWVFAASAGVGILVQQLNGRLFDKLRNKSKWGDETMYGLAGIGNTVIWMGRLFVYTLRAAVTTNVIGSLFMTIFGGFYSDYMHLGGKRMGSIAYWVYAEVMYSLGSLLIFTTMLIGVWYGVWMEIVLLSAALWSLVTIVEARESNLG